MQTWKMQVSCSQLAKETKYIQNIASFNAGYSLGKIAELTPDALLG